MSNNAAVTLSFRRIFGINGNVTDNISFADDDNIVYVAGHNIVIYNKKDRNQKIINFNNTEISDTITAFASWTGKRYEEILFRKVLE